MKLPQILAYLLVGLFLIGATTYFSSSLAMMERSNSRTLSTSPGTSSQTPTITSTVTSKIDIDKLPTYPKAQNVTVVRDWPESPIKQIDYYTDDDTQQVQAYYKQVLLANGWILSGENSRVQSVYIEFHRIHTTGQSPYGLAANILIDTASTQTTQVNILRTHVSTQLERLPDASAVPLYADASDVVVSYKINEHGVLERITNYNTNVQLRDLEQYYRNILPTYGWHLGGYSSNSDGSNLIGVSSIEEGLMFTYHSGGPEASFYGIVTITVKQTSNKGSIIEMVASDNDISNHYTSP